VSSSQLTEARDRVRSFGGYNKENCQLQETKSEIQKDSPDLDLIRRDLSAIRQQTTVSFGVLSRSGVRSLAPCARARSDDNPRNSPRYGT
jgi:hypothetical protein